ncbi:MAG TPA: creatininase family protein [Candidatus Bathyarchaeia archaeon]|nr:creatininase family protein [Candidatus Bathyarchaeia archaeon]
MKKPNPKSKSDAPKKPSYLWLDELSTTEAQQAAKAGAVVIFPVGSVEEHGKHLPLCTDSLEAEYTALEVAEKTGCLVAPPFRHGICNAGRNFPGTISIEFDTLYRVARDVLSELVRNGFCRIIVLSGHAGQSHMVALRMAAQNVVLQNEGAGAERKTRIMVLSDFDFAFELRGKEFSEKDGHAGTIETSRMMAIKPELVKGKGEASFPQMPRFEVVAHPEQYFPSGVMGDPTAASESKGRLINKYVIEQVAKLVEELASN